MTPVGAGVVPTIRFPTLWHVGHLDPAAKGPSYEGKGLSVSTEPGSWRKIARLGDAPTWAIDTRPVTFVDTLALDLGDRGSIEIWALAAGLIEAVPAWHVTWYDDEIGTTMTTTVLSAGEAAEEAGEGGSVTVGAAWLPTPRLVSLIGPRHVSIARPVPVDLLLIAYFDTQAPAIGGLWWQEAHDPARYSAPRGVVFPRWVGGLARQRLAA